MGKITSALRKAADERIQRIDKINKFRDKDQFIVTRSKDSKVDPRIITYFDPKALITEQYKILRTNILSLNKGKAPKTLVMTSSIHSEGKTISAINLAVTFAYSVHKPKVLLIDADMRRGRVSRYLGIDTEAGLSEVLRGQADLSDTLFNIKIENLDFLASGSVPENPAELLSSDAMQTVLNKMRGQYDHIIIDTPPIIAVTDAGILGAKSDGVIMVVQAGRTQRGIVKRAKELLYQSHAKVLGHVLTNIEYHLPEYIYRYL